ncbi:hypothetical protein WA158_004850 [Blastocystis sp. Blastoise]
MEFEESQGYSDYEWDDVVYNGYAWDDYNPAQMLKEPELQEQDYVLSSENSNLENLLELHVLNEANSGISDLSQKIQLSLDSVPSQSEPKTPKKPENPQYLAIRSSIRAGIYMSNSSQVSKNTLFPSSQSFSQNHNKTSKSMFPDISSSQKSKTNNNNNNNNINNNINNINNNVSQSLSQRLPLKKRFLSQLVISPEKSTKIRSTLQDTRDQIPSHVTNGGFLLSQVVEEVQTTFLSSQSSTSSPLRPSSAQNNRGNPVSLTDTLLSQKDRISIGIPVDHVIEDVSTNEISYTNNRENTVLPGNTEISSSTIQTQDNRGNHSKMNNMRKNEWKTNIEIKFETEKQNDMNIKKGRRYKGNNIYINELQRFRDRPIGDKKKEYLLYSYDITKLYYRLLLLDQSEPKRFVSLYIQQNTINIDQLKENSLFVIYHPFIILKIPYFFPVIIGYQHYEIVENTNYETQENLDIEAILSQSIGE